MVPSQRAPWHEYREVAETISQAVAEALSTTIGTHVELGIGTAGDPEEMLCGRPLPLQAIVVRAGRPLRDVMIFISSLKEETIRPLVQTAVTAAARALDLPSGFDDYGPLGELEIEAAVQYETIEDALEQCDALYLEAVYGLELPTGELQMVLGTGLLEAATFLQRGEVDPFAEGEGPYVPAGATMPAATPLETDAAGAAARAETLETAMPVGGAANALDALDAELAAQDQAESRHAATPAVPTPALDASAALSLGDGSATHWTDLLSGVDVELSAELGRANLPLGEITSLHDDSVLSLDQLVDDPVTVYVNGTPYATARLVVVDGEYGIEIIEVFDTSSLVSSLAA